MIKMKVVTGFRFNNQAYPASETPVTMPAEVAQFALEYKLAEEVAVPKTTRHAKSKGQAPENK